MNNMTTRKSTAKKSNPPIHRGEDSSRFTPQDSRSAFPNPRRPEMNVSHVAPRPFVNPTRPDRGQSMHAGGSNLPPQHRALALNPTIPNDLHFTPQFSAAPPHPTGPPPNDWAPRGLPPRRGAQEEEIIRLRGTVEEMQGALRDTTRMIMELKRERESQIHSDSASQHSQRPSSSSSAHLPNQLLSNRSLSGGFAESSLDISNPPKNVEAPRPPEKVQNEYRPKLCENLLEFATAFASNMGTSPSSNKPPNPPSNDQKKIPDTTQSDPMSHPTITSKQNTQINMQQSSSNQKQRMVLNTQHENTLDTKPDNSTSNLVSPEIPKIAKASLVKKVPQAVNSQRENTLTTRREDAPSNLDSPEIPKIAKASLVKTASQAVPSDDKSKPVSSIKQKPAPASSNKENQPSKSVIPKQTPELSDPQNSQRDTDAQGVAAKKEKTLSISTGKPGATPFDSKPFATSTTSDAVASTLGNNSPGILVQPEQRNRISFKISSKAERSTSVASVDKSQDKKESTRPSKNKSTSKASARHTGKAPMAAINNKPMNLDTAGFEALLRAMPQPSTKATGQESKTSHLGNRSNISKFAKTPLPIRPASSASSVASSSHKPAPASYPVRASISGASAQPTTTGSSVQQSQTSRCVEQSLAASSIAPSHSGISAESSPVTPSIELSQASVSAEPSQDSASVESSPVETPVKTSTIDTSIQHDITSSRNISTNGNGIEMDSQSESHRQPTEGCRIFLPELPAGTAESDLLDFFSQQDPVAVLILPKTGTNQTNPGTKSAYVHFRDSHDAEQAKKWREGEELHGVPLNIEWPVGGSNSAQESVVKKSPGSQCSDFGATSIHSGPSIRSFHGNEASIKNSLHSRITLPGSSQSSSVAFQETRKHEFNWSKNSPQQRQGQGVMAPASKPFCRYYSTPGGCREGRGCPFNHEKAGMPHLQGMSHRSVYVPSHRFED